MIGSGTTPAPEHAQAVEQTACPLCKSGDAREFHRDRHRIYLRCRTCNLIFVPSSQFLSASDEKRRYDQHRNSAENKGYRQFLSRMLVPLAKLLPPGSIGLDFGSGPEPLLSRMFEEAGYSVTTFDYFYKNDPSALAGHYDFITATEVVEHLHDPGKELERLWTCLKPGGYFGIMTKCAAESGAFPQWYYKNDRTHVCFYSQATFKWLAARWNAEVSFHHDDDVVLFRRKAE